MRDVPQYNPTEQQRRPEMGVRRVAPRLRVEQAPPVEQQKQRLEDQPTFQTGKDYVERLQYFGPQLQKVMREGSAFDFADGKEFPVVDKALADYIRSMPGETDGEKAQAVIEKWSQAAEGALKQIDMTVLSREDQDAVEEMRYAVADARLAA
jgi:hypothetical protein